MTHPSVQIPEYATDYMLLWL